MPRKKTEDFFVDFDAAELIPEDVVDVEVQDAAEPLAYSDEKTEDCFAIDMEDIVTEPAEITANEQPKAPKKKRAKKESKKKAQKEPRPSKEKKRSEKKEKEKKSKKKESSAKKKVMRSTQIFSKIRDVRDGIIITKTGEFIKILEFSPINFMLRNEAEKDGIIADYMSVIRVLPENVQFKIISKRADVTDFVRKIEEDMQSEENANCRQLQREQIRLIRDVGSRQAISRRFFIIIPFQNDNPSKHLEWEDVTDYFDTITSRIRASMHRIENELISVESDEYTLELLYQIMCRKQAEEYTFQDRLRSTVVRHMMAAESENIPEYLPVNDLIAPNFIDTKHSKFLVIDGLYYAFAYVPSKSYPTSAVAGWLNIFTNLGDGVDVDVFLKKMDSRSSLVKLQYAIRMNKINLRSTEDTSLDYEDKISTVNAGYYLKDSIAGGDSFCYFNTLLTITESSEEALMSKCAELKKFCETVDIPIKMCDFRHEDAFLSTLPLCNLEKNLFAKSKRNIMGNDFASTYPFSSYEVSDEDGILLGINNSNNSLVFVDNFDSNKYANANMVLLGMSGAGKTYTMQCIALRMRERKTQTFIIAPVKGHEFKRACAAIGGAYINISPGSGQNINIMEIRPQDDRADRLLDGYDGEISFLVRKCQQLLVFFSLLVPDITHEERQLLDEALLKTYADYGITNDNESLWDPNEEDKYKPMPVLGDLHQHLKEGGERTQRLYTILSRFVTGSAASFNIPTNVDLDNKYVVLDVSNLTKEMLPIGMFIALDYVWDKAKEDRTKKKAVFIDEAWQLIGPSASTQSAEFVLDIFKLIRGYGGAAIAATQDLNDFFALDNGSYGKAVINNSKLKLIMKLEPNEAKTVQAALDLTDAEIEECARFDRGEGILIANTNHVIVNVKSSRHENDLITTKREDLQRLAREKEAYS